MAGPLFAVGSVVAVAPWQWQPRVLNENPGNHLFTRCGSGTQNFHSINLLPYHDIIEILQHNEAFKRVDNKFVFQCIKGIVRIDGVILLTEWDDRHNLPTNATQLRILQEVQTQDRGPLVKEGWTVILPNPHYYIKTPNIHAFHDVADLEGLIAREVETCELLKLHPHQNISPYFGCTELRGRVSGVCFKKHQHTLLEKFNPLGLNKAAFISRQVSQTLIYSASNH